MSKKTTDLVNKTNLSLNDETLLIDSEDSNLSTKDKSATVWELKTAIFSNSTTDDLSEWSNLYYTDARVNANSTVVSLWTDKEDVANKSTDVALWTSDTLYPSQNAVKVYVDNIELITPNTKTNVTYWETISAWDALRNWAIITTTASTPYVSTNNWAETRIWYNTTYQYPWQSIQTITSWETIKSMSALIYKSWTPTGNLTMKVYSDTSGTLVATSSNTISESTDLTASQVTDVTFNFANESLPIGTYYVRIETDRANSTTNYTNWVMRTDNEYPLWASYYINSSNTWILWTTNADKNFTLVLENFTEDTSKIYKTDATDSSKINFIWFASESWVLDDVKKLNTAWVDGNQSGLTIWSDYYLSDTAWEISTTPWTNSVKVWKAISATEILINTFEILNPVDFVTFTTLWWSASYSTTYSHNLWKIPTKFELDAIHGSWNLSSHWYYEDWKYGSVNSEWWAREDCIWALEFGSSNYFIMTITDITNTEFTIDYTEVWSCSSFTWYCLIKLT